MPTIIDLRPEIEKVSGRIAIVALLILCLCIKVYTTQFWHDMNVNHRVKCKVIDRIVEDETITQDGNSTTKKVNKLVLQAEGFNNTFKLAVDTPTWNRAIINGVKNTFYFNISRTEYGPWHNQLICVLLLLVTGSSGCSFIMYSVRYITSIISHNNGK